MRRLAKSHGTLVTTDQALPPSVLWSRQKQQNHLLNQVLAQMKTLWYEFFSVHSCSKNDLVLHFTGPAFSAVAPTHGACSFEIILHSFFFLSFSCFFFDCVAVLLFCVQQWVASIDGNVPFWPPSYVIKQLFCYYVFVVMENKLSLSRWMQVAGWLKMTDMILEDKIYIVWK